MQASEAAELQKRAASGDVAAREHLIESHRKFILWAASRACRRSVDPDMDDEWSIALIAFNEAIDAFRPDHGANFLSHARLVISRRLVDHFRQSGREDLLLLDEEREDDEGSPQPSWIEEQAALDRYLRDQEVAARAEEIERYATQLAGFGLSLDDLEEASPSHRDTRQTLLRVAGVLGSDRKLMASLFSRRQLPVAELTLRTGASRKILEIWRRYVIAVAIILAGDYDHLREFVRIPPPQGGS